MPFNVPSAMLLKPRSHDRLLLGCLLASMVVHLAVFSLFPGIHQGAPNPARVLTAIFLPRATHPEPAPQPQRRAERPQRSPVVEPAPELPRPALAAPEALAPREPESPTLLAAPAPAVSPSIPASPQIPAAQVLSGPRAAPVEAPSAPAVTVQPVARAPVINDAGNVDQFRIALMSVARQYNRYPIQARERGWTGRVEVRLVIGAEGTVESVLVKSSSGYDILDNRALDMIRKAKLQTPVPAALRGREFSIDIPVDFILQTG